MPDPGVDAVSSLGSTATGRTLSLHFGAAFAALVVLYLSCAELSLLLAISPGFATPVWPPSGIALAALLLYGVRLWPAIWLAAFLTNAGDGASLLAVAAVASGNTLEALCACWLVHRLIGRDVELSHPE